MNDTDLIEQLSCPAPQAAQRILGGIIRRTLPDGTVLSGRIVETEAYDQTDPASHTFRGRTNRNASMFGPAGHAYVYFTYGMYFCLNVVCGVAGQGAGVLIRAVEPLEGIEVMRRHRGDKPDAHLTNGPGKLCQALQVDRQLDGHDLSQIPLQLQLGPAPKRASITAGPRIGLRKATETPWRFVLNDDTVD